MKDPLKRFEVFRKSLLGKLSLSYLSLTIAFGMLYGLSFYWIWKSYSNRYSQGLQWDVAEALSAELAPFTTSKLDLQAVEPILLRFRAYNPSAEPFLLSETGAVLASLVPTDERVPIEPIRAFVEHRGYPMIPLFGPQPQPSYNHRQVIFSAHPLVIEGKPGFVYVSLESTGADIVKRTLGDAEASFAAFLLMAVSSVAASIVGFMVFRHLTRRLRSMGLVLEDYGQGRYQQRMPVEGSDELTAFAKVLNSMADAILLQIEKLTEVDTVRRHLVASVTHDIRNPIAQMRVCLEAASNLPEADEKVRLGYVTSSLRALDSLTALIEDLFELSKISADGYSLNREPVELGELASDIAVSFAAVAEQKQIAIRTDIPHRSLVSQIDLKLVSRALSNLIDNAIKYSDPKTTVTVELATTDRSITICIRDQGAGFETEELDSLAQPFHRGRSGRGKNEGGTGLGLAIARKAIELHGGTLTLQNAEPKGAEIVLTLPRE